MREPMNNKFNIGDIIQSNHRLNQHTIFYLITDLSISKQLYKVHNITFNSELLFDMNDSTHKNYEIVSKS
jgi:hypothetical protein